MLSRIFYYLIRFLICFFDRLLYIFAPLLDATKNPERHPFVAEFLKKVTAFDIVDDEGQVEMNVMITYPFIVINIIMNTFI